MAAGSRIPVYCICNARRHSPLALGLMMAHAKSYDQGRLKEVFDFHGQTLASKRQVEAAFREHGPGIYLISDYLWTINDNIELSEYVKQLSSDSITIHGGPSAPAYPAAGQAFFENYHHVDVVVRGEGEATVVEMLDLIGQHRERADLDFLSAVEGITYRSANGSNQVVRTPDRPRSVDPNEFASPYLTGHFDPDEVASWTAAIVETNRGCPYGCTFCDWGSATRQKIRQFSLDRVQEEIEWLAKKKVPVMFIGDANFGIFQRDVEIAEMVSEAKRKYGFPRQIVTNYAKHSSVRLAEILRIFVDAGLSTLGIISIQTQDPQTLSIIRRSNIKTSRYEELIGIFRKEKLPISTELMSGLPGATVESFKSDLQFFVDRQVSAIAYPTRILPNSPMADPEYIKEYQIEVDEDDFIVSTFSYTPAELLKMHFIFDIYRMTHARAILKHFLYYLRIDHGIKPLDFIDNLVDDFVDWRSTTAGGTFAEWRGDRWRLEILPNRRDPLSREIIRLFSKIAKERPLSRGDWKRAYAAVREYTCRRYGIEPSAAMDAVLAAQAAVMPSPERSFPDHIQLEHDVVAYFDQIRETPNMEEALERGEVAPLAAFPPGEMTVTDPTDICLAPRWKDDRFYDGRMCYWELSSPLSVTQYQGATPGTTAQPRVTEQAA